MQLMVASVWVSVAMRQRALDTDKSSEKGRQLDWNARTTILGIRRGALEGTDVWWRRLYQPRCAVLSSEKG